MAESCVGVQVRSGLRSTARRVGILAVSLLLLFSSPLGNMADEMSRADSLAEIARADRTGDGDRLVQLADELLRRDPAAADAHYFRGRERFRRGDVRGALADFDRYVELRPEREPPQWERGIAMYYAKEYARGARQFELYQTYDNRDVENSVWRYLCMAKDQGVDKARAALLPIERDPRIPMMEVFGLFAGRVTPEQLLAAARADDPPADVLEGRLFYVHLYLGLYHDSAGNRELSRKYIDLAADEKLRASPRINVYMWAVARVHQRQLMDGQP